MERVVLCMMCGSKPAADSCSMCGRVVCKEHFDASTGLCTSCSSGRKAVLGRQRVIE
ncbi:MAG: hypothetical protein NT001_05700 [Candidatus Woesearchaeota archaeon]|nr:hypothetical protein [Candidatus Woesearchaeota archaeon]